MPKSGTTKFITNYEKARFRIIQKCRSQNFITNYEMSRFRNAQKRTVTKNTTLRSWHYKIKTFKWFMGGLREGSKGVFFENGYKMDYKTPKRHMFGFYNVIKVLKGF